MEEVALAALPIEEASNVSDVESRASEKSQRESLNEIADVLPYSSKKGSNSSMCVDTVKESHYRQIISSETHFEFAILVKFIFALGNTA